MPTGLRPDAPARAGTRPPAQASGRRALAAPLAALLTLLLAACQVPGATATDEAGGTAGVTSAEVSADTLHPVDPGEPRLPVTVESWQRGPVTVTDVSRIVTVDLYGTLTEIVYALGLGDNLVGRDRTADFPGVEDVPVVSAGGHDLSAEAVLDLDPTVVLTDTTVGPHEVVEQLQDAGVTVVHFTPERTLDGIGAHVTAVAEALGVPEAGRRVVADVEAGIAAALELAADADPVRVAFVYLRGTAGVYLLAGPGSGADDMIEAVGAVDVGTDIGLENPFVPLTSEAMIAAEPDVLLVMSEGLDSVGGVDGLVAMAGISQTPAAQHRRVVAVDDNVLLSFGPRTGSVITALAEAVHGVAG